MSRTLKLLLTAAAISAAAGRASAETPLERGTYLMDSIVACGNCHIDQNYKNVGLECNDCHAIQDVHQERFGRECSNCHTEVSWKPVTFDHETSTRFPLRGAHAKASCESCHGESIARKVSVACASCHREQDVHRGQLGNICEDCHNALAWDKDVAFDHGLTNYPLTGLHTVVACEACHATPAYKDADMRCSDCHADDDVHDGRFATRCEGCRNSNCVITFAGAVLIRRIPPTCLRKRSSI